MCNRIRTLLFGEQEECRAISETLEAWAQASGRTHESFHLDDLEELEKSLTTWQPSLLVVLADGAEGMECVVRSTERQPLLPVFWFSDDRNFCIQSYRLNCAYFSSKPATPEKVGHAFQRCDHLGITYGVM